MLRKYLHSTQSGCVCPTSIAPSSAIVYIKRHSQFECKWRADGTLQQIFAGDALNLHTLNAQES